MIQYGSQSRLMRKPTLCFPNRSDTHRPGQSQKNAYAKRLFSHEAAHILNIDKFLSSIYELLGK